MLILPPKFKKTADSAVIRPPAVATKNEALLLQQSDYGAWWQSPVGAYARAWEEARLAEAVADSFGYHSLQWGQLQVDGLRASRVAAHHFASLKAPASTDKIKPDLLCQPVELPFAANSLDVLVMPHVFDMAYLPRDILTECMRVLVPQGVLVVTGFNTTSLWYTGLRSTPNAYLPPGVQIMGFRLLRKSFVGSGLEIVRGGFGAYRPAWSNKNGELRMAYLDKAGDRWWPTLGSLYWLVATKRVLSLGGRLKPAPAKARWAARLRPDARPIARPARRIHAADDLANR